MFGDGAEVPEHGIYKKNWPKQDKGQAAMITRMDRDVVKSSIFSRLKLRKYSRYVHFG